MAEPNGGFLWVFSSELKGKTPFNYYWRGGIVENMTEASTYLGVIGLDMVCLQSYSSLALSANETSTRGIVLITLVFALSNISMIGYM